jgi:hypothetical protein
MANTNTIFGARLIDTLTAAILSGKANPYSVPATDGTALYVGDFVKLTGECDVGEDGFYHPTVTQAAATDTLVGFVVGFGVNPSYLEQIHRTASTLRTAWVIDDPSVLFEIQSSGTVVPADVGLNADIVVASGSAVTGLSGMQLDHGDVKTATAQLRIVRLSQQSNAEFGAYTKLVCFINEHAYKGTVGV